MDVCVCVCDCVCEDLVTHESASSSPSTHGGKVKLGKNMSRVGVFSVSLSACLTCTYGSIIPMWCCFLPQRAGDMQYQGGGPCAVSGPIFIESFC